MLKYRNLLNGTIENGKSGSYLISADKFSEMLEEGKNLIVLRFNDSRANHDGFMPCMIPNHEISILGDPNLGQYLTVEVNRRIGQTHYLCHVNQG